MKECRISGHGTACEPSRHGLLQGLKDEGTTAGQFTDVEPWALPRVYADFLPCLVGVTPLHGAKVALGQYVGVPSIPFGHTVGRKTSLLQPASAGTLGSIEDV